ncbi:hypothetical protein BDU57DRAFT_454388, partial [Ampelomyces quisqualis]
ISLKDQAVLITGPSIARRLAHEQGTLILFARSDNQLKSLASNLRPTTPDLKIFSPVVDRQDHTALSTAISNLLTPSTPHINIPTNNPCLAISARAHFPDLKTTDILTTTSTNINSYVYMSATHAALQQAGKSPTAEQGARHRTLVPGLAVPPFPGDAA